MAAMYLLSTPPVILGNTEDDVIKGQTDLTAAGTYGGGAPSTSSDVTFASGTYSAATFTVGNGFNLSIGTLNDLASTALTIQNGTANTTSTITLNGGSDSVAGSSTSDLLYVASGSTLNIVNDANGALNLALAASGNFDIAGAATIGSVISGAQGFTKTGNGTLTINPNVARTPGSFASGATTITFANTSGLRVGMGLSGTGIATGTYITAISGNTVTLSAAASAANTGISITATGSFYSGGTTLSAGTLQLGNNNVIASGGNVISGLLGTGGLTITGGTTVKDQSGNNATLSISNSTATTVNGSFTIDLNATRLTWDSNWVLNNSPTISLNSTGSVATFATILGASGGSSVLRLDKLTGSTGQSFSGGAMVFDGTSAPNAAGVGLLFQSAGALNATNNSGLTIGNKVVGFFATGNVFGTGAPTTTPALTVAGGGYLSLSSASTSQSQEILSLAGGGTVTNLATAAGTATLTINGSANATFSGTITDGASLNATTGLTALGVVALTKNGSGVETLSGANTYTGTTTVSGGALNLGNANALQNSAAVVNAANGLTFNAGIGTFNLASLGGTGNLVLSDNGTTPAAVTLSVGSNNGATTESGVLSGLGGITKVGTGTLTLSGVNTYAGGTTVNDGVVSLGSNATFAGAALTSGALGTGTLTLGNGGSVASSGGNTLGNAIAITGNNVAIGSATQTGRVILANSMDLTGTVGSTTRTVSLFRNTAPGAYTSNTGLEQVQFSTQANGPTSVSVANGNLRFAADASVPSGNLSPVAFSTTVSFTGNAGLILGNGVITTLATSAPFGTTTATSPRLTVESGGYLNLGAVASSRNATVYSLSGAGVVTNLASSVGTGTVTINGADTATFSGTIADGSAYAGTFTGISGGTPVGAVALTMNGAGGTQILTGANTYTGATTVSAGALLVNGSVGTTNTPAGAVNVASGATLGGTGLLTVSTATVTGTLAPGATLGATTGALTLNTTGGLALNGTLQINITASGGTSLATNGALTLGAGSILNITGTSGAAAYDIANYVSENGTFGMLNIPTGYTINYQGTTFNAGGDIELVAAAVPEPSTWLAGVIATVIGAAATFRRRYQRA